MNKVQDEDQHQAVGEKDPLPVKMVLLQVGEVSNQMEEAEMPVESQLVEKAP